MPFRIPKLEKSPFHVQTDRAQAFYSRLHYHPEIQLTAIIKGEGSLICGEYMGEFFPGDIFMFGSYMPHLLRSVKSAGEVISVTLFISPDFLEGDMFGDSEKLALKRLSVDALGGLEISRVTSTMIRDLITDLPNTGGLRRLALIIRILDYLVKPGAYRVLLIRNEGAFDRELEDYRMNEVVQFTIENFSRDITLEEAAEVASLTRSSFCRYFKQRTRKTYSEFVSEIRINQACQLLKDRELSIREVCFAAGYSNISNFNRKFRAIRGMTPSAYRKQLEI